jgi:hypothetical protein
MQFQQEVELPMSARIDQQTAMLSAPLIVLFATAIGVIVTNLFAPRRWSD